MRIAVLFMMLYYSLGNLLFPTGNLSYSLNLHEMYQQCSLEDTDITPLDFVFEHLLNLEDVIAHFGHEENEDKPHQPSLTINPATSVALAVNRLTPVISAPRYYGYEKSRFPVLRKIFLPAAPASEIFRPPIV
jgi:hypothetical protein